jgi:flagellar basal-body rod protein FlgG
MMLGGINSVLSALRAFLKKVSNTANNVANIHSAGFNKRVTSFQEGWNLKGVQITSNQPVHTQGPRMLANNPLNIAVNHQGFLRVSLPNGGTGYLRDGNLKKDSAGRLVTLNGNPIQQEISISGNAIGVNASGSGQDSAITNGLSQVIGQIEPSSFRNPGGQGSLGNNLFIASNAFGPAVNGSP